MSFDHSNDRSTIDEMAVKMNSFDSMLNKMNDLRFDKNQVKEDGRPFWSQMDKLKEKLDFTYDEFAEKCGISKSKYKNNRNENKLLDLKTILCFCIEWHLPLLVSIELLGLARIALDIEHSFQDRCYYLLLEYAALDETWDVTISNKILGKFNLETI